MIQLKQLSKSDVFPFYEWLNDEDTIRYSMSMFQKINSKLEINVWFNALIENSKILNLGIFMESTNELIGYAGLCNFSKINQVAEYYIFIGNKKMWRKGIGTNVTKQILKIGFLEHNLNRIFLTASEPNVGGIKAYENSGFQIEGKLRQACFRDNEFHDKVMMSILKKTWEKAKL